MQKTILTVLFLLLLGAGVLAKIQDGPIFVEKDEAAVSARIARELADEEERKYRDRLLLSVFLWGDQQEQGLLPALELVDDQKDRLEEIRNNFVAARKELVRPPGNASPQQFQTWVREEQMLERKFVSEIRECLLDSQVEALRHCRLQASGVVRLLVDSPIGDVLRIQPAQQTRIRAASNQIAEKIAKFNQEIREESFQKIMGELTKEQKEKLVEIYSADLLNKYYEQRTLLPMFYDHNIDNEFDMTVQFDIEKE